MTEMHTGDRHYRNTTLRLADFTVTSDTITGVTFENCSLDGPAVVFLQGDTSLRGNEFAVPDLDALLLPIPATQTHLVGVIALVDCTIVGCTLRRISIAAPEHQMETLRQGFGG